MSRQIVINLGLPKSGTTTLARALREAGFNVADYRIRRRDTENAALHGRFVAGQLYDGYFTSGDPLEQLAEFDAFTELSVMRRGHSIWPQTDWGLIDAIRSHHPGAMFLASSRDAVEQSASMLRWSDMGSTRLPRSTIPGLPRGYGHDPAHQTRWIKAHHAFLARVFSGERNFLQFDIADPDAPKQIAAFLGRDLPWWGRLNANPPKDNKTDRKAGKVTGKTGSKVA